jgi:uncharacterized membrane protein
MTEMTARGTVALVCALGSGLIAGFFFAFSICVMKALGKLPPAQGIAAMQSINVVVINPVFLIVFLGTGALCLFTLVGSIVRWQAAGAAYLLTGSLLYVVGSILVTMVFNVPRNNALAAVAPDTAEAATLWASYLSTWTAWNHVRMVASLGAAAAFTIGWLRS